MGFGLMHLDGRHRMTLGAVQSAGLSLEWALGLFTARRRWTPRTGSWNVHRRVPAGSGGLFPPLSAGRAQPLVEPHATGCFTGLTPAMARRRSSGSDGGRRYNLRIILRCCGSTGLERLKMVGGGARNACWLKALADVWQMPLDVARVLSGASSTGAALCAAIGIGAIPDFSIGARVNPAVREILPDRRLAPLYEDGLRRFKALYQALEPVAFAPADQGEN